MKTGRTLQELAIELDRQNRAKRDFIVSTAAMQMEESGGSVTLHPFAPAGAGREIESFNMTSLFHRQLGSALGIPSKYYDLMQSEYPELLTRNVNGWLGKKENRHTVRTLDGTARAFLSDRYRRIDNFDIAQNVLPVISDMPDARVESCEVTDNRMYLKVVNTRLTTDVVPGDTVQAGIVISNSEVGLGSVSVMPLLYRLVCSNGMIINDLCKRKYHVGRENEESWELYRDETLQADDAAFMLKLQDIVRTAVDETRFAQVVDKLREAAGVRITGHIPEVVELTSKEYGFNKTESDGILQHLITGGDLSLYGLGNAVTRASHDVDSYDRATALETAGWQIVTTAPQLWSQVNRSVV